MRRSVLRILLNLLLESPDALVNAPFRVHWTEIHPRPAPAMHPHGAAGQEHDHEEQNTDASHGLVALRRSDRDQGPENQPADQSTDVAGIIDARGNGTQIQAKAGKEEQTA